MKKTPLRRTKGINKMSTKQKERNKRLDQIRVKRAVEQKGLCAACDNPPDFRGLQLHHSTFRSQGGEDNDENLILVCARCHSQFHNINEVE